MNGPSENLIQELSEKEFRDEFVADQVRTRIALLIRGLREQHGRGWSQAELGRRMDKPQNVVSRLENPDYGKMSLQTLLDVAAAFDLPLWVDLPDWSEWLRLIQDVPGSGLKRVSYDADTLLDQNLEPAGLGYSASNQIRPETILLTENQFYAGLPRNYFAAGLNSIDLSSVKYVQQGSFWPSRLAQQ